MHTPQKKSWFALFKMYLHHVMSTLLQSSPLILHKSVTLHSPPEPSSEFARFEFCSGFGTTEVRFCSVRVRFYSHLYFLSLFLSSGALLSVDAFLLLSNKNKLSIDSHRAQRYFYATYGIVFSKCIIRVCFLTSPLSKCDFISDLLCTILLNCLRATVSAIRPGSPI